MASDRSADRTDKPAFPAVVATTTSAADIARQFNVTIAEVDGWVKRSMEGGKEGVRAAGR